MRSSITHQAHQSVRSNQGVIPEEELPTTAIPTGAVPSSARQSSARQQGAQQPSAQQTAALPTALRTDPTVHADKTVQDKDKSVDEEPAEKEPFLGLKPAQVVGGILASSTAAIVGGQLGVAGTVAGAALTSFTIVVSSAVYTRTFDRTKDGIGSAVSRLRLAGTPPTTAPEDSAYAAPEDDPTRVIAAQAEAKDEVETVLPWYRRIAPVKVLVAAAGLFLIAAVVVTGLEFVRGGSVSGGEGTTIGQISRGEVTTGSNSKGNTGKEGTTPGKPGGDTATDPTAQPSPTSTGEPTTRATSEPTTAATTAPTTEPSSGPTSGATTAPTTAPTSGSGTGGDTGSGTESGTGSGAASGSGSGSGSSAAGGSGTRNSGSDTAGG